VSDVAAAFVEALGRADWPAFAALWLESERDAAVERYRDARAEWETYDERVRRSGRSGDEITAVVAFAGLSTAGVDTSFEAAALFELESGLIRRATTWHAVTADRRRVEAETRGAVLEYFRAANAKEWEALSEVFAADPELTGISGEPRHGRDNVVGAYARFLSPWVVHHDEVTRLVVAGRSAAVEVHFTGTTRNGSRLELDVLDLVDVDDGRIERLSFWIDLARLRRFLRDDGSLA
jgi:ketosteroid isomerase-like protein